MLLVSLQLAAERVPPVFGGDDEWHGRREGPTGESEVSRSEGGDASILSCGYRGSHMHVQKQIAIVRGRVSGINVMQ